MNPNVPSVYVDDVQDSPLSTDRMMYEPIPDWAVATTLYSDEYETEIKLDVDGGTLICTHSSAIARHICTVDNIIAPTSANERRICFIEENISGDRKLPTKG